MTLVGFILGTPSAWLLNNFMAICESLFLSVIPPVPNDLPWSGKSTNAFWHIYFEWVISVGLTLALTLLIENMPYTLKKYMSLSGTYTLY